MTISESFQGHMDSVLCVEFDHRRLISGSMDRTIRIWDIRSGRSIHKLYAHKVCKPPSYLPYCVIIHIGKCVPIPWVVIKFDLGPIFQHTDLMLNW